MTYPVPHPTVRRALPAAIARHEPGSDRVWLTAALLGQHPLSEQQAQQVRHLLGLPDVGRRESEDGARVRITLDGKFPPHKW